MLLHQLMKRSNLLLCIGHLLLNTTQIHINLRDRSRNNLNPIDHFPTFALLHGHGSHWRCSNPRLFQCCDRLHRLIHLLLLLKQAAGNQINVLSKPIDGGTHHLDLCRNALFVFGHNQAKYRPTQQQGYDTDNHPQHAELASLLCRGAFRLHLFGGLLQPFHHFLTSHHLLIQ